MKSQDHILSHELYSHIILNWNNVTSKKKEKRVNYQIVA